MGAGAVGAAFLGSDFHRWLRESCGGGFLSLSGGWHDPMGCYVIMGSMCFPPSGHGWGP